MPKKLTAEEFIKKAILIHGDKYKYNPEDFKGTKNKIFIFCNEHQQYFEQMASDHIHHKNGCPLCGKTKMIGGKTMSLIEFLQKANDIHENKYDYSKVKFKDTKSKILIICKKHKTTFEKTVSDHIYHKSGCQICGQEKEIESKTFTQKEFEESAIKVHGENRYDYTNSNYVKMRIKIDIKCLKCNFIFKQRPAHHIHQKAGCPICKESHGEREIFKILTNKKIQFEKQKKFSNCKYKQLLPFDFYLPTHNMCIEFNGEQHYKSFDYMGGKEDFKLRKIRDKIKKDFCKNNNIQLLIIKYNEDIQHKINETLTK